MKNYRKRLHDGWIIAWWMKSWELKLHLGWNIKGKCYKMDETFKLYNKWKYRYRGWKNKIIIHPLCNL